MNEIIKPLKILPEKIKLGGDYNITQMVLMLGLLAKTDICIRNYNRSNETSFTLSFLNSIGCISERSATEIVIKADSPIQIDECAELEYEGGAVPLAQIVGFLAGKNICCSLKYANSINSDLVDLLVNNFSKYGVDLFHKAEIRQIYFRSSSVSPIECTLSNALPYLKNSLLFYSLTCGQSISIKEIIATDSGFENLIKYFGGNLSSVDTKSETTIDPNDPRKKIRVVNFDYKRKIDLKQFSEIEGGEIIVPSDYHSLAAFILLAILKKKSLIVEDVYINDSMNRFIKFLKGFAADVELSNKKSIPPYTTNDLTVTGREAKGRKLSGRTATALMELIPYISIAAAVGNNNTVIRDIAEYGIWQNNPFNEISLMLKNVGIKSGALEDGLVIEGKSDYDDDKYGPFVNKEIALAFYILILSETVKTTFNGFEIIADNYPEIIEAVQTAYDKQLLSKLA